MKKTLAVLVMVIMAVGFEWSLPQEANTGVLVTIKNQFSCDVSFYINGRYRCSAPANSSRTVRVKIGEGPYKLEARDYTQTKIIASKTLDTLAPGKNIIWETGNVELNPIPSPISSQAAATPSAAKGSTVSYMASASTLNFQGQKTQNRFQTASLAKIERQTSPAGATYALSGQGGFQMENVGTAAYYEVSPITVNRDPAGRLSTDRKGLNPWLTVVNSTLSGLSRKNMTMGTWEEPITLALGEGFPETVQARFRARPLPEPDSKWTLITADSGLISFRALDAKYQDAVIYGRYQGVLVYAPKEDTFLQAAAAFTLYHGEDKFRIEQFQYAADSGGNPLYPILDAGPFLNFATEEPKITAQGVFPSWCIQAAYVLDILHLAVMTAAEGCTNPAPVSMVGQSSLNLIYHVYYSEEEVLRQSAADQFLGDWKKLQDLAKSQHIDWTSKPIFNVGQELSKGFISNSVTSGSDVFKTFLGKPMKPLYVASHKMIDGKMYDIKLINDFPNALPPAPPGPTTVSTPAPQPAPPPDKVKKAPASAGGNALLWELLLAGLGGAAAAYELGLFGGGGGDVDCEFMYRTVKPLSKNLCEWMEEEGDPWIFSVPLECGCLYGTKDTGGRSTNPNGMKMMTCIGCF